MGLPIQKETAAHKLNEAMDAEWINEYSKESLELAAAQLAIALAASNGNSEVGLLVTRVEESEEGTDIVAADFLSDKEKEFLPAAQVVINLVQLSAQFSAIKTTQAFQNVHLHSH